GLDGPGLTSAAVLGRAAGGGGGPPPPAPAGGGGRPGWGGGEEAGGRGGGAGPARGPPGGGAPAGAGAQVSLPRTAEQQWEAGTEVSVSEMQPGDLVFSEFAERGPAQVGIYAGDGQMIHAAPAVTADTAGGVAQVPVPGDARARRVL
uniref:C40 family peptidase n=1 Tax=Nocardia carnea TaxID=37328 RepID=UPI0024548F8F